VVFAVDNYIILFYYIDFKKENGFHGMPVVSGKHASPYHIPVVGEERDVPYNSGRSIDGGGYNQPSSRFGDAMADDFDGGKYGLDDVDDSAAPISDVGGYNFDHDDLGDAFDFGPSPFKYHRDVSTDGLKGDAHGYGDQVSVRIIIILLFIYFSNNNLFTNT